jgi:hypothetical protein
MSNLITTPQSTREEIIQAGKKAKESGTDILTIGKELGCTVKQIVFAGLYCSLSRDYFGNIEQCASEAWNIMLDNPRDRKRAKDYGYNALKSEGVKMLCSILIDSEMPEAAVDREMHRAILQDQDWNAKIKAAELYAKIKNRIKSTQTVEHIHTMDFSNLTEQELRNFIDLGNKAAIAKPTTPLLNVKNSNSDD